MGNILGDLLPRAAEQDWVPNIPPDLNNPNQPYSRQMRDMVLHFSLPMFCIVALAYLDHKNKQAKTSWLEQQEKLMAEFHKSLREGSLSASTYPHLSGAATLRELLTTVEKEEEEAYKQKAKKIDYYDAGLESVLNIRCSLFKSKLKREKEQDQLVARLYHDFDVNGVVQYSGLKDVFDNDYKFCGANRKENGKLRQLYVRNWKLQIELEKYRNIVEKLKQFIDV